MATYLKIQNQYKTALNPSSSFRLRCQWPDNQSAAKLNIKLLKQNELKSEVVVATWVS